MTPERHRLRHWLPALARVLRRAPRFIGMPAEQAWPLLQRAHQAASAEALRLERIGRRRDCHGYHAEASIWLGIMLRLADRGFNAAALCRDGARRRRD